MFPISRGFPQTDRIYEEIIYLVNNDDEKFTTVDTESDQIPISRLLALDYIEKAFSVPDSKHIEVSKDAAVKKFSNNTDRFDENALEMKPFSSNSYNISPGTSLVGKITGHAFLIRTLLRHELNRLKVTNFQWTKFEFLPRLLISIHSEYYKIDETNACFAKWIAYSDVHKGHPLDLDAFSKLLDIIVDENEDDEEVKKNKKGKIKKAFSKINPFKKKKNTDTKDVIIGDQLNTKDEQIEKLFCESKRSLLNSFLFFMKIIHNSGTETVQNEDESDEIQNAAEHASKVTNFNKILEIINRLERIYMMDGTTKVLPHKNDLFKLMIKNFENGTVEHLNKNVNELLLCQIDENDKKLDELIRVIRFGVKHRENFVASFDQNFRR